MELLFLVASQNQRARHRNVIFDGIAGDSQCKYLNTPAKQLSFKTQNVLISFISLLLFWTNGRDRNWATLNANKVSQSFMRFWY